FQTRYGGAGGNPFYETGSAGDAFVAKLNPAGSALVYSTYLGGSLDDRGTAIAVDSAGNAYIGGVTLSTNFPVKNAYQATYKGGGGSPPFCCSPPKVLLSFGDGFLTKLNPAGTALVFSTYFGGSLDDTVTSLALDGAGNIYIGGSTLSPDLPVLHAYQSHFAGAASPSVQPFLSIGDGYVAEFNPAGSLVFSTYLGGSSDDAVMGLAVDSAGAIYVTGFTSSADFPVTANAPQRRYAGGGQMEGFLVGDAFVAKLMPSTSAAATLVYSTYLGGSKDDAGMAIVVDVANAAYVAGFTNSTDFPISNMGVLQPTFGGSLNTYQPTGDGFLSRITADGSETSYSTYYGGRSDDAITALALDAQGNLYLTGSTTSTNLPVTSNAAQKVFAGSGPSRTDTGDAFVAKIAGLAAGAVIAGVFNAASETTALAPGSFAVVFGQNLGTVGQTALVGGQAAPVLFASPNQWNVLIPNNATLGATTIQVGTAAPFPITLTQYAPALFSSNGSGSGSVLALRAVDSSFVNAATPAIPGDTIYIYATGLGVVDSNGHPSPMPTVTVGGQPVTVVTAAMQGADTFYPFFYQVTIQLPATLAAGSPPVVLSIGGASSQTLTLPVGPPVPLITAVVNGASFLPGIVPDSWLTIWGTNLSPVTDNWANAIVNGQFPTKLDGVSVSVNGQPGYVYYISPTQINLLAPDTGAGAMQVTVTNSLGTSAAVASTAETFGPAFFMLGGTYYAIATYTDYSLAAKNGAVPGVTTVPAKPGDTLILWGTGFGPTNPAAPVGAEPVAGVLCYTADTVTVTIGGINANMIYSVLSGYAGLYQIAIQVPAAPSGDQPIVATVGGVSSPATTLITIQ
ncbi:MAG: SBBP repeat-containing protein, partial [Bryobacteraceae bacterium]